MAVRAYGAKGTNGNAAPKPWLTSNVGGAGTQDIQTDRIRLLTAATGGYICYARAEILEPVVDPDITVLITPGQTWVTEGFFNINIFDDWSATTANEGKNGYQATLRPDGTIGLGSSVASTYTAIAAPAFTYTGSTALWVRFKKTGSYVRLWAWPNDNSVQPVTPAVEGLVTDGPSLGPWHIGFAATCGNAAVAIRFDVSELRVNNSVGDIGKLLLLPMGTPPTYVVTGTQVTETDTANSGTPLVVKLGTQVTETDTPNAGVPLVVKVGAQATTTTTANAGVPLVVKLGSQATTTSTPNAGVPLVVILGTQVTETDTPNHGSAPMVKVGGQATETDTPNHGLPLAVVSVTGLQATEIDTPNSGTPLVIKLGGQSTETDTPNHGLPFVAITITGSQVTETDSPNIGVPKLLLVGTKVTETDTPNHGVAVPHVIVVGSKASETDTANHGVAVLPLQLNPRNIFHIPRNDRTLKIRRER